VENENIPIRLFDTKNIGSNRPQRTARDLVRVSISSPPI